MAKETRFGRCSCGVAKVAEDVCPHGCHLHKKPHVRIALEQKGCQAPRDQLASHAEVTRAFRRLGYPALKQNPNGLFGGAR